MKQWMETREVLDFLARVRGADEQVALATVVRVRGSAYRHEGAKLAVARDGSTAGNVSGGCLEQDVREVALEVIRTGRPELRRYCSGSEEIAAWDLGLGCEGEVELLIEPVGQPRRAERALLEGRTAFAVSTPLPAPHSRTPGPGAKQAEGEEAGAWDRRLIVTRDAVQGDLGSAVLNAAVAHQARKALAAGVSGVQEIAGGAVYIDVLEPPPELVVIGAGEDARPLVHFAAEVGFRVVVVDRRPSLLTHARFPAATLLLETTGERLTSALPLDGACHAVVMTHNFADDQAYLRALLASPVAYIGLLGPRQRSERLLRNLRAEGAPDDPRLYGPVGLDIGTDGAEQVALAVIAEILAVRSGRRPRSLRERAAAIHASAE